MKPIGWILLGVVTCALPGRSAVAQGAGVADSVSVRAAVAMMRSDLRNFVVAQESFFADNERYATSMTEMAPMYVPSRGVRVILLSASPTGHSEIAVHGAHGDIVCGMFVGTGTQPLPEMREGDVACRGIPMPESRDEN
ncbi:MAG TPA: hypothetical protein VGA37_12290 [Gemmatimonadales bacterium]